MNRSSLHRVTSRLVLAAFFLFANVALVSEVSALEGKWTPQQVLELDAEELRAHGLEMAPSALWGRDGAGLLDAAVSLDDCSAGFVSPDGLLATNHHCVFSILQVHSTPERDLIELGFVAKTRAEELSGGTVRAQIPHRSTDVTAEVEAAAAAADKQGNDDLARFHAIERKGKELVAACERTPSRRCQFAAFDGGVRYLLLEAIEYPDVRLAWAPPLAIGNFGGEVDNWSWPRHTGDFGLLRVWANPDGSPAPKGQGTVPLRPRHYFPVAPEGISAGGFVMVAGYPGTTFRSLAAEEMRERAERLYPGRAALFRAWIDLMESRSQTGDAARIALADRVKNLANREKNSRGQIAGFARGKLIEKKALEETAVLAWARGEGKNPAAVAAWEALVATVAREATTWDRDFLLDQSKTGPKPLDLALTLVRWASERAKPDLEREPPYMERNHERLAERLQLEQSALWPDAEVDLLTDLLTRFAALENGSPAVTALLAGRSTPEAIRERARQVLDASQVAVASARAEMARETVEALRARKDPLLDFAFALDIEIRAREERRNRRIGAESRLRPTWRRAVQTFVGKPIAPDANGTLRISFAHVQGYRPRDGVFLLPQTTLRGVVEKHTGALPFNAPPALLAAAPRASTSRFADPKLGDVPVAFLADCDTTGGNSGSPVVDGRGRLVGINFDRVWENVANDFGWNPEVARNVSVDVRYLLWNLETLGGDAAKPLLEELLAAGATDATEDGGAKSR